MDDGYVPKYERHRYLGLYLAIACTTWSRTRWTVKQICKLKLAEENCGFCHNMHIMASQNRWWRTHNSHQRYREDGRPGLYTLHMVILYTIGETCLKMLKYLNDDSHWLDKRTFSQSMPKSCAWLWQMKSKELSTEAFSNKRSGTSPSSPNLAILGQLH